MTDTIDHPRTRDEIRIWLEINLKAPTVKIPHFTVNTELFIQQTGMYYENTIYSIFQSELNGTYVWWIMPETGEYDLEAMSVVRFSTYDETFDYAVEYFYVLFNQ
jgi:hypothetical protein